ncbi:MAG: hypothetical protein IPL99_04315 [Candidatus Competibacteraceae bacterium]|nr:hypothetical protein [Candidatus Competibacteraceae bacterium]
MRNISAATSKIGGSKRVVCSSVDGTANVESQILDKIMQLMPIWAAKDRRFDGGIREPS